MVVPVNTTFAQAHGKMPDTSLRVRVHLARTETRRCFHAWQDHALPILLLPQATKPNTTKALYVHGMPKEGKYCLASN